jgi:hypothetical protein
MPTTLEQRRQATANVFFVIDDHKLCHKFP